MLLWDLTAVNISLSTVLICGRVSPAHKQIEADKKEFGVGAVLGARDTLAPCQTTLLQNIAGCVSAATVQPASASPAS